MSGFSDIRKKVRNNIKSLLLGQTSAGDHVYTQRTEPMFPEEIECINIYIISDTPIRNKKIDWNYNRRLMIAIEILVRKTADNIPEDVADLIDGAIEDRLLPNIYLQYPPPDNIQLIGGEGDPGAEIVEYFDVEDTSFNKTPEGLVDVYGIVKECVAEYHYNKKTGLVTPFETANIHYDLEGKQAVADQAEDKIELPQP